MDQSPTLKTERLHLSALVMSDADAVFTYASKPQVSRFMTWATHTSIDDAISFLRSVTEAPSTQYDWGIRLAPSDDVVGALLFSFRTESEAEIHYTLDEPYWGRGFVTEACFGVLEWAFSGFPMLERVVTAAATVNRGSTRVMEKLGMSAAGSYEEVWAKDGATHHMSIYEISRTTWEQQEPRRMRPADSTTERGNEIVSQAEQDRRVDYIEFGSTNIEETKRFYSGVFDWEFTDYGPDYTSFSDGRLAGGFSITPDVQAGGPLVVIYSTNLAEVEARIGEGGGQIVRAIFEFPGGRRFHFTDPSGNELAVWSDQ